MKSQLHKKILSRGYWQVVVRPTTFTEKLIPDISSLLPLLQKNSVQIRGMDFPHFDHENLRIGVDWIEQEFDWQHYKAMWRFYQSGQFFQIASMPIDWLGEVTLWSPDKNLVPGKFLSVADTIATLTEIYEFAARLALSNAGSEFMQVKIDLGNLQNRTLYDEKNPFLALRNYEASIEIFPYSNRFSRAKLVSNSKDIALQVALEIFKRFKWNLPDIESLRSWQDKFRI